MVSQSWLRQKLPVTLGKTYSTLRRILRLKFITVTKAIVILEKKKCSKKERRLSLKHSTSIFVIKCKPLYLYKSGNPVSEHVAPICNGDLSYLEGSDGWDVPNILLEDWTISKVFIWTVSF